MKVLTFDLFDLQLNDNLEYLQFSNFRLICLQIFFLFEMIVTYSKHSCYFILPSFRYLNHCGLHYQQWLRQWKYQLWSFKFVDTKYDKLYLKVKCFKGFFDIFWNGTMVSWHKTWLKYIKIISYRWNYPIFWELVKIPF